MGSRGSFFSTSTLQCNNISARFCKNDLRGQSCSDSDSVNRLAVCFPKSCKQPETAAHLFTSQNYKWIQVRESQHQNLGHQIKDALKAIRNPVNPLDVCTRWNPLNIQAWSGVFVGHVEATVSLQLLVCPATWCAGYRYHGYLFVCPPALAVCLVVCPWSGLAWLSSLVFFFSVSLPVCLVWLRLASVHVRKGLSCYQDFLSKQL